MLVGGDEAGEAPRSPLSVNFFVVNLKVSEAFSSTAGDSSSSGAGPEPRPRPPALDGASLPNLCALLVLLSEAFCFRMVIGAVDEGAVDAGKLEGGRPHGGSRKEGDKEEDAEFDSERPPKLDPELDSDEYPATDAINVRKMHQMGYSALMTIIAPKVDLLFFAKTRDQIGQLTRNRNEAPVDIRPIGLG